MTAAKITSLLQHYFVAEQARSPEGTAPERTPEQIRDAMRAHAPPPDDTFDRYMPPLDRVVSGTYWTPLAAASRVAEWLDEFRLGTLVDIGSGAGKLCVAAALASDARFIGVEHRPRLVESARALARTFAVEDRVSFVEDAVGDGPVPEADAYYLYNPFGENLFWYGERLDDDVELSEDRFARDVAATESLLHAAPLGTYVFTYNGFGGEIPALYEAVRVDRTLPNMLRLWRKTTTLRTTPTPLDGD
jgi:hypothetical protein